MSRRGEGLVLVLAAVLAALAVRSGIDSETVPPWLLPVDDAYIFVRFAQQAAAGRPMQWNPGEISTGATDPAFTLLLVPGQWLFDGLAGWSWWSLVVGVLCLAGLGWTARSLAHALLARPGPSWNPWPLAAGLAVVGGGPFAYFSVGGMDNAFAAAMLLGALARVVASGGRLGLAWVALLPWVRPDFAVVVAAVALLLVLGRLRPERPARSRLAAASLLFAPGLALMALNLWRTGHVSPGGMLAKSVFSTPMQPLASHLGEVASQFLREVVPVYVGLQPTILPPPVGLIAVCVVVWALATVCKAAYDAAGRPAEHEPQLSEPSEPSARMLAPALTWIVLVVVAGASGYLGWQRMRHHHPGLALAWVFAFVALASLTSRWTSRLRPAAGIVAVLALGFLPWLGLAEVARDHAASTLSFYGKNFRAAAWLQQHVAGPGPAPVVAVHDAGLLSLATDGPLVDVMGLGTTDLAIPYRDGVGALVEHLARRRPLPNLAVGRRALLRLGPLLGEPLFVSSPDPADAMVAAPIRQSLLRDTALEGPGIDFGFGPSERRAEMHWSPPPPSSVASLGVVLADGQGPSSVQGCRPVYGELRLELGDLGSAGERLRLTFTAVTDGTTSGPASITVSTSTETGRTLASGVRREASAALGEAIAIELPSADALLLRRQGSGLPCVESLGVGRAPGDQSPYFSSLR